MGEALYLRLQASAGAAALDLSQEIVGLTLEEELGRPAELNVRLPDPNRTLGYGLVEGVALALDLGTAEAHPPLFRGLIYGLGARLPNRGAPSLELLAYDGAMRLGLRRRARPHAGSLSQVVKAIGSAHGLSVDVRPIADAQIQLRQHDETDLAFLLRLAEENGCALWADVRNTLHFVARRHLWANPPTPTLVYGREGAEHKLLSFEADSLPGVQGQSRTLAAMMGPRGEAAQRRVTPGSAPEREDPLLVEALAHEYATRPAFAADLERLAALAPSLRAKLLASLEGVQSKGLSGLIDDDAALSALADNLTEPSSLGVEATGQVPPQTPLRCGQLVRILGVGGAFSGSWLITRLRRTLRGGDHTLEFRCAR